VQIIAACRKCHTQYDVTGRKPDETIRCRCGELVAVPQPRAAEARLVRCPSCGAVRGGEGPTCDFCGARFSTVDKGWGSMCPCCYCRLPNDAQFCVECGLRINPQKLEQVDSNLACPRCKVALQGRILEQIEIHECGGCAGLWVTAVDFETIVSSREAMGMTMRGLTALHHKTKFEMDPEQTVKYIPCPKCRNLMNRRNFAGISGVIIDTCAKCGVWLDNQELNRIIQFIESGGMDRARQHEAAERAHAEQMHKGRRLATDILSDPLFPVAPTVLRPDPGTPVMVRVLAEVALSFFK
jgi:Zn-finger nucleic acid-binding protein